MRHIYFLLFIYLFASASCSTGKKALERGDYYQAISKAVERLQSDPDNRNAIHVLDEGYPMAIKYYQEEIDLILTGNDPFKWGKTVQIMEKVNDLSEQVRKVPAARKQIATPKTYSSEMRPAKEKAADELYQAGIELMETASRENARQAYQYFLKADQLIPGFDDVNKLIRKSKDLATYKVIVEQTTVFTESYSLSSDFFYDRIMGMLKYHFPKKSFINFYSANEAGNQKIEHPDMVLKMNFFDFHIGQNQHLENEQTLSKDVEEQVKTTRGDAIVYETKVTHYQGTLKTINDQVFTEAILNIEVVGYPEEQMLLKENIPGQFLWNNSYGVFVGDKEVLSANQIAVLNNSASPLPSPQSLFIELTRPIFDQTSDQLKRFFGKYN